MTEKTQIDKNYTLNGHPPSQDLYAIALTNIPNIYSLQNNGAPLDRYSLSPVEATSYQDRSAGISKRLATLRIAHTIGKRYAEHVGSPILDKARVRKQVSIIIDALLDGEELPEALSEFNSAEMQPVMSKLDAIKRNTLMSLPKAADLSVVNRKVLSGSVVRDLITRKYTRDQVEDILAAAGYTPEEQSRITKVLLTSAIFGTALNLMLGQGSEVAGLYLGLNHHDEIVQYINNLDPETRSLITVALPVFSQVLVYATTAIKNNMSNKMYENGVDVVADPNILAQNLIDKQIIAPDEKFTHIVSQWVAHFLNPLNLLDEKWYGTLAIPDGGVTFMLGNFIAAGIKTGVITAEYLAILSKRAKVFDGLYEKYFQKFKKEIPKNGTNSLDSLGNDFVQEFQQALQNPEVLNILLQDFKDLSAPKEVKRSEVSQRNIFLRRQVFHQSGD